MRATTQMHGQAIHESILLAGPRYPLDLIMNQQTAGYLYFDALVHSRLHRILDSILVPPSSSSSWFGLLYFLLAPPHAGLWWGCR